MNWTLIHAIHLEIEVLQCLPDINNNSNRPFHYTKRCRAHFIQCSSAWAHPVALEGVKYYWPLEFLTLQSKNWPALACLDTCMLVVPTSCAPSEHIISSSNKIMSLAPSVQNPWPTWGVGIYEIMKSLSSLKLFSHNQHSKHLQTGSSCFLYIQYLNPSHLFFFFWETNNHIPRSKLIHICLSVVWCWAWSAFLLLFLFFSFSFFWAPLRITALKRPGVPPQGSSLARPCCVAVAGPEDAVRGRRLSGGCSKWESMSHLLVYGTYSTEYIPQREGWLRLSDQKLWEIEGWVDFEVGLSISYIRYSTVCTVSTLVYCNEKYISLIIHSSCD